MGSRFMPPLFLLLLLPSLLNCGTGAGAVPSPFQLAPDTPAPAEPTPTRSAPRPDPCEGRPCLNGGFCLALPSPGRPEDPWEYTCMCGQGFTGRNCEFFTDPCSSSPCLHGNCSLRNGEEEGGPAYTCECSEGYEGPRCHQIVQPVAEWEAVSPSAPQLATPVTSATSAATQPPQTSSVAAGETPAAPTLLPWQPKTAQRLLMVPWEADRVTEGLHCVSPELCELTATLTLSLEVPEETAVKLVVNAVGAPALWRVNEEGFLRSSFVNGSEMWFMQSSDGLVVPDHALPLGQNYFLSVIQVGAPTAPEVTLRLNLTVKASSCVEPGSSFSDPQCSGKGKCVTQPSESTFFCECDDSYTGIFCEEFDACHHRPCRNNATCADVRQGGEGHNFTCSCQAGYEGERCQLLVNHCLSQPCENGGTCSSSLAGPHCFCPEGYQGSTCEQQVDPCASGPCHNNGTCYPQGGAGPLGFGCSCTSGFTGPTCTQLVDFCALNPCAHGVCRSVGNSYRCLCIPGYHGLYCEEEYNECLSAPCQNYATCRDLINAYECVCTPQFEGRHCEIYKDPCLKMRCLNGGHCDSAGLNASCTCPPGYTGQRCEVDINECESNPCHHGGTCIDQPHGYTCHCHPGWVGPGCEIHLQWKPPHSEETLTNMPRHSLYIIIGALCVAFVLMLIILIVGICRISRIEYQGSSRHAYQEFYNCRSIDSEFGNAIASIRHARFAKKSRPAMYDATPISYEDYSPDDKPLVTLIKTKDL